MHGCGDKWLDRQYHAFQRDRRRLRHEPRHRRVRSLVSPIKMSDVERAGPNDLCVVLTAAPAQQGAAAG